MKEIKRGEIYAVDFGTGCGSEQGGTRPSLILQNDIGNSSFAYSVNLLKMLLAMQLITEDEYERIAQISAEHYGADLIYV